MKHLRLLAIFLMIALPSGRTNGRAVSDTVSFYRYPQKNHPNGLDNYLFSAYYYNDRDCYNMRGLSMGKAPGQIMEFKINPSGANYAIIYSKGKKSIATVNDLWKSETTVHLFKDRTTPSALAWAPDARSLFIADGNTVYRYNAQDWTLADNYPISLYPDKLEVSPNGYFLVCRKGELADVINLETKEIRKSFDFGASVKDLSFSSDSDVLGVLFDDGSLSVYDTRTFLIRDMYDALGESRAFSFNRDGKYASVISGDGRISVVNLLDDGQRSYIEDSSGQLTDVRFVRDGKQQVFLLYNNAAGLVYKKMTDLKPYYAKLLAEELKERMDDWMKRMPGETLEEYELRVNDETREQQARLFEQEIATRMAGDILGSSSISLGNYNPETGHLAITFDRMPAIFLEVPEHELIYFKDAGDLSFSNVLYGITKNDTFELIYAEVLNRASGKTYIFDNKSRSSLEYLRVEDSFIPLDLIRQSSMEEMRLQEIRDHVMDIARGENRISQHTNISVNAGIVSDYDADGRRILNYKVGFTYDVEAGYSAKEDFPPGRYRYEQSPAAMSMLQIVKTAFETDFASYIRDGRKVRISITGMADALPISNKRKYTGDYGEYAGEPCYKGQDLGTITILSGENITENEQLAFLRATGVMQFIHENLPVFEKMQTEYIRNIEINPEKGGEFRRISVEFLFVDAF